MNRDTEIRHLLSGPKFAICQMLDQYGWKEVMSLIPSNPLDSTSTPKYTADQIQLISSHGLKNNKSCTEILLQEWGTSGKVRPTLQTLVDVLVKAELFRAADYITVDIFGDIPRDRPKTGPAATITVNLEELNIPSTEVPSISASDCIPHLPYFLLQQITDNFNETLFQWSTSADSVAIGHKLGAGAFGSVYYGVMPNGTPVAVKKLMSDTAGFFQQFQTEIAALSNYRHPNLLPLVGYSCDSLDYCIVYEFMPNGSLLDKLKIGSISTEAALCWETRVEIAVGLCRGIHYLHTSKSTPLIHRDIKTANILLDKDNIAHLGDFGLVKTSPTDSRLTSTVFGTSAYMAPEAFRGDVSVKMDVFSAGVVFLELLTALPPYDDGREGADIVTFIEEAVDESIAPLADVNAHWDLRVANDLFELSKKCLEDKKHRPFIGEVLERVTNLMGNISNRCPN